MSNGSFVEVSPPTLADRARWGIRNARGWLKHRTIDAALALIVWLSRDSRYLQHLRAEVRTWFDGEDGPNRWIAEGTEQLLAVLSHQGHSGGSIGFALQFFTTMARFKPWGPLTGEDHEWVEVSDGLWQNRRCSHVFKNAGGAYDIDGRVFHDGDHLYYTNRDSRVPVTFPYTPPEKPEIVDTTAEAAS